MFSSDGNYIRYDQKTAGQREQKVYGASTGEPVAGSDVSFPTPAVKPHASSSSGEQAILVAANQRHLPTRIIPAAAAKFGNQPAPGRNRLMNLIITHKSCF